MEERPQRLSAGHFFGCQQRMVETAGLVLSEVRYEPGLRVPPHAHELGYFCLLVDGGYWEQYGGRRVDYTPRSLVFHPPGDEHHGDISPLGGRCFNIEFLPGLMQRLRDIGPPPPAPIDVRGGDLVWLATRLYREFCDLGSGAATPADGSGAATPADGSRAATQPWRRRRAGSSLVVEGLGLEMLGGLVRRGGARESLPPRWLRAALDRLNDELDRPLTVGGVAADLGVSSVRLSRAFRRFCGETLGDRLRRLRVERACELLADSDARLADIALEVGFADQSHLTRVFKRHTSLTPGRYRRLSRG